MSCGDAHDLGNEFDEFADMDGLVKFDFVRGCHDDALARVPRGRDECRLAHQAQRMTAEQRAIVIGLLRKYHLHEPGFVGTKVWRRR